MQDYQREFIELALAARVLQFGEFTLKSGRVSPYFFNTGRFNTGGHLERLGRYYASAIVESGVSFDMLYGPAYKGIPLVSAASIALADNHGRDLPYCFNRKEVKTHGEGGGTVGAPLAGRVLIIDDVISAGTSVRESVEIIRLAGAQPAGVAISLNRQERGQGATSAIQEVEAEFDMPVISIIALEQIMAYLDGRADLEEIRAEVVAYHERYGVT